MESIDTALILAVAGAALIAARAFRSMTSMVIDLTHELKSVISELHTSERENTALEAEVNGFDSRMAAVEARLDELSKEVQRLKGELENWRGLIEGLQPERLPSSDGKGI